MSLKILTSPDNKIKFGHSESYNFVMNFQTGFFARWGQNKEDDPDFSPFGPEIADIEISTICNGINGKPCKFCYKSNTGKGENMSFETFQNIFHKLPKTLNQIAFGIGDIDSNPDMFKIMEYCRNNTYNYVVPNVTINGWNLTDEYAQKLSEICGAIAVSHYGNDICYNAVQKLTDLGMKQVNIHQLVSKETYEKCLQIIDDAKTDPRLSKLNAIVFLALKPKGRGTNYTCLKDNQLYKNLIEKALNLGVNIGFDSCSAPMFLEAVKDHPQYQHFSVLAEPCESYLFSIYINYKGETVPCSFMEDTKIKPINLLEVNDFMKEVWYSESTRSFRDDLLNTTKCSKCRKCPVYDIY